MIDEREKARILVVDDDSNNLNLLTDLLTYAGYKVLAATDGDQCLEYARLGRPDAILLDILMPEMDGYDICKRLKTDEQTRDIPVIFITGLNQADHIVRAFEVGGVDYIVKPFRQEEVLARLASHITIRRQKEELIALKENLEREVAARKETMAALVESETRLNEGQAVAGLGSWERDLTTGAGAWSDNQFCLFGYAPGEAQGSFELFKKHVHPDDLDAVVETIGNCIEKMTPYDMEYRYIPLNGEVRYAHAVGRAECDETGRPVRIYGTLQDITEKKQREIAFRRVYEQLDGILKHSPNVITIMDRNGRYVNVNPAGARVLNKNRDEIIGKSFRDVLPPPLAEKFHERVKTVIDTGQSLDVEDVFAAGAEAPVFSTLLFPIYDNGETASLAGGIGVNVTERKKAERERLRMLRRIQTLQRLESMAVMAGGVAHDFNNILMVIIGNLEFVKEDMTENAAALKNLREAERAARQAAGLARQMLAFSGKGHFIIEPVDLDCMVRDVTTMLKSVVSGRRVLDVQLQEAPLMLEGDAKQLRQAASNLILNAAESYPETDSGGVIDVVAGAEVLDAAFLKTTLSDVWMGYEELKEGRYVFLEVRDHGVGMDAETQRRMFEPFFSTKFQGRGLGLAAVIGIVRGHKGFIRVDSAPGRGTVIRIWFPAAGRVAAPATAEPAPEATPASGKSGLILLIDDEASVRNVVRRMLERMGFTVIAAGDGPDALSLYRIHRHDIDLVLTDLSMPGMNGVEVFAELRRAGCEAPVALSSGYGESEIKSLYAAKGFAAFIQKPYQKDALAGMLQSVLEAS